MPTRIVSPSPPAASGEESHRGDPRRRDVPEPVRRLRFRFEQHLLRLDVVRLEVVSLAFAPRRERRAVLGDARANRGLARFPIRHHLLPLAHDARVRGRVHVARRGVHARVAVLRDRDQPRARARAGRPEHRGADGERADGDRAAAEDAAGDAVAHVHGVVRSSHGEPPRGVRVYRGAAGGVDPGGERHDPPRAFRLAPRRDDGEVLEMPRRRRLQDAMDADLVHGEQTHLALHGADRGVIALLRQPRALREAERHRARTTHREARVCPEARAAAGAFLLRASVFLAARRSARCQLCHTHTTPARAAAARVPARWIPRCTSRARTDSCACTTLRTSAPSACDASRTRSLARAATTPPHLGGAPAACWGASRRLSTTTTATLATTRARFARALAALLRDHAVGLDVISSWGHALVPAAVDALSRGDDDDDLSSVLREVCVLLSSATTHGVDDGAALDAVVERALMHLADKERAISKNGGVFGGVGGARTPATMPPSRLASCGGLGFGDRAPPPGGLFLGGGGMSQDWSGGAGSASGSGVGSGRSSESQPTTQTCVGLRPSPGHALAARQLPATFSFSNAASAAAAAGAGAGDGERGGGGGDEDVARGRLLHLLADLLAMSARRGVLPATFQPRQIAAAAPVPAASSLSSQTLSLSQPGPGGFSQGFPQLSPPTSSQADEYASLGIVPAHVRRVSGANECAPHPLVSLSQRAARSTAAATVKNHPRASSPGVAVVLDAARRRRRPGLLVDAVARRPPRPGDGGRRPPPRRGIAR